MYLTELTLGVARYSIMNFFEREFDSSSGDSGLNSDLFTTQSLTPEPRGDRPIEIKPEVDFQKQVAARARAIALQLDRLESENKEPPKGLEKEIARQMNDLVLFVMDELAREDDAYRRAAELIHSTPAGSEMESYSPLEDIRTVFQLGINELRAQDALNDEDRVRSLVNTIRATLEPVLEELAEADAKRRQKKSPSVSDASGDEDEARPLAA